MEAQKGNLKFLTHRSQDKLDPGFRIVGYKLRWIAASQTEEKMGRIWRVLKKSELPKDILEQMQKANRDIFGRDDTIRSRELVLAYADEKAVNEERKMLKDAADSQLAQVTSRANPFGNPNLKVDEAELTRQSGSDFFNN